MFKETILKHFRRKKRKTRPLETGEGRWVGVTLGSFQTILKKKKILRTTLHPTVPPSHAPKPPINCSLLLWQKMANLDKKSGGKTIISQFNQICRYVPFLLNKSTIKKKKQLIKILNVKLIKFSQINYHEFEEKCNPTSKIELSILKLLKIQKDT